MHLEGRRCGWGLWVLWGQCDVNPTRIPLLGTGRFVGTRLSAPWVHSDLTLLPKVETLSFPHPPPPWGCLFYTLWCPTGISDGPSLPPALGLALPEVWCESPPALAPLFEGRLPVQGL